MKKLTLNGWWALAGLSLLAVALGACGGGEQPALGPTPTGGGVPEGTGAAVIRTPTFPPTPAVYEAAMGVDVVAGGGIEASRTVTGPTPFEVDVVVLNAGPGYQGYQFNAQWDPAVLAYDSQVHLMPEELNLCATPTVMENTMFTGCARVQGNTSFQGPLNRLTFHCVGQGTSTIHLLTPSETVSGSTLLAYQGFTIATEVKDASVTCAG